MFDPSKKAHFWQWFVRNRHLFLRALYMGLEDGAYLTEELLMHLNTYCNQLGFEISTTGKGRIGCLVITAYGQRRHFAKAEQLVAAAPPMPDWEIIALRPPREIDYLFGDDFGDTGINPLALRFEPYPDVYRLACLHALVVYAPDWQPEQEKLFYAAVYMIVENLLGEELAAKYLGCLVLRPLSACPHGEPGIFPMAQLRAYFDRLPSVYKVNNCGVLLKS